jgi:hypothetical protein
MEKEEYRLDQEPFKKVFSSWYLKLLSKFFSIMDFIIITS